MANRLSQIATRTGDDGTTGLGDGQRVPKNHLRVQAMGDVDELNSQLGLLLTEPLPDDVRELLIVIQHELFNLGGELSIPGYAMIDDERVLRLEAALDRHNAELPPLKEFILPGGSPAAAHAHVARTICRRAERSLVRLRREAPVQDASLRYLNRLSDLLFVLARSLNRAAGGSDVLWQRTPPRDEKPPPQARKSRALKN
ncbi:MAG TPA: cob(I)yrinic acid a,c-diamide adenosyltransferase [Burkholderiaceae bacterium]|nr:cob(I)yrinic acid a,c-diamide adenosyltransferase [Burkholderiaceae bacterium]